MATITLTPTGHDAITFEGDHEIHLPGSDPDGHPSGRWHDIDVYRLPDGSLAVSIQYRTSSARETEHCSVDTAVDVLELDAILSLYEPKEFVVMEPGPARRRVTESLTRRYDAQVTDLLEQLRRDQPTGGRDAPSQ